jgi:hypothetical protein
MKFWYEKCRSGWSGCSYIFKLCKKNGGIQYTEYYTKQDGQTEWTKQHICGSSGGKDYVNWSNGYEKTPLTKAQAFAELL